MEHLIDAVVAHLLASPHLIHMRGGAYGNKVDRIVGREVIVNVDEKVLPDDTIEAPGPLDFEIRQTEVRALIVVNRNGGLRFDPVYFPRVEIRSYGTPIAEAWDLDRIVSFVMERSGVVRYEGQKFGSPVGESDGIPDLEEGSNWPYIYRSFLMTMVGPTLP